MNPIQRALANATKIQAENDKLEQLSRPNQDDRALFQVVASTTAEAILAADDTDTEEA